MSQKKARKKDHAWLKKNAYIAPSTIEDDSGKVYLSNVDGSYLTRVGMENEIRYMVDRNLILVQSVHSDPKEGVTSACLGYNAEEQKWYGWSHRAMYGFGIGSKVVKGDCAYCPVDRDDFLDDCIRFWSDEDNLNVMGKHVIDGSDEGVEVSWILSDNIPNGKLRGKMRSCFSPYPDTWGRGEWEARTLNDARIMASNFARSVS